jgi:hypothetical protein
MASARVIRVSDAAMLGFSRQQLRGASWTAPFRGVRTETAAALDLRARCQALLAVAPRGSVISGLSAAKLYGWWLPYRGDPAIIDITVPPPHAMRRGGVDCHRRIVPADHRTALNGLAITTPVRTLLDLAASQPLIDLIVLADAAMQMRHCTFAELVAADLFSRREGGPRFKQLLEHCEPKSESAMETLLRLSVVFSGLPRPLAQVQIFDAAGLFVARGDLLAVDGRSVFEYDGRYHNEPERHASDVRRWRALRAAGFEVYPYTAIDLFKRPSQIITDYQRAVGLPIDPGAVRGWLEQLKRSSYG